MKPHLLAALVLALSIPARADGVALRKLDIEGFAKPVLVAVPNGYTATKSWGLVLVLHGTGMNGAHMADAFRDALGEVASAGYLVAFPSSNHPAWSAAGMADADKSRELALLRKAVETIRRDWKIDERCVHGYGFSCGTVALALALGFRTEWDGLPMRSFCGNSGGLAGTVAPAKAARAKETAVWILNGEADPAHADVSRNIHQAFKLGGYDSRYTVAWGIDHGFPLAPVHEMLEWWRTLDGDKLAHHPAVKKAPAGYEVPMVPAGSLAARAGLRVGDRLMSADGNPLNTTEDVSRALTDRKAGDRVTLTVTRGRTPLRVVLTFPGP